MTEIIRYKLELLSSRVEAHAIGISKHYGTSPAYSPAVPVHVRGFLLTKTYNQCDARAGNVRMPFLISMDAYFQHMCAK